ncbi:hypothetical protein SNARM312S_01759 [Streptomyces narbonensis]
MDGAFHRHYWARAEACGLTAGAAELLAARQESGLTQSLLSLAPHAELIPLVRRHGIAERFVRMDGRIDASTDGKSGHMVRHLAALAVPADRVVVIGDAADDAVAAAHVGAKAVLYTGGSHSRASLERAGGSPVVDSRRRRCPRRRSWSRGGAVRSPVRCGCAAGAGAVCGRWVCGPAPGLGSGEPPAPPVQRRRRPAASGLRLGGPSGTRPPRPAPGCVRAQAADPDGGQQAGRPCTAPRTSTTSAPKKSRIVGNVVASSVRFVGPCVRRLHRAAAASPSSGAGPGRSSRAPASRPNSRRRPRPAPDPARPTRASSSAQVPRSPGCRAIVTSASYLQERRRLRLYLREDRVRRLRARPAATCRVTAVEPRPAAESWTILKEELLDGGGGGDRCLEHRVDPLPAALRRPRQARHRARQADRRRR